MQKFWTYFIVVLTIWPIGMQFGAWRNYFKHELFWDFILKKCIHNKKTIDFYFGTIYKTL